MKGMIFGIFTFIASFQQANSHYFNMGGFLRPYLQPQHMYYSQTTYNHGRYGRQQPTYPSSQNKNNLQRQTYLSNKKQYDSRYTDHIDYHNHRNRYSQPLKKPNQQGPQAIPKDLYQAIGIPENIIVQKIIPVNQAVSRDLYLYFESHQIRSNQLYHSVCQLKKLIEWIQQNYLKNINTIVLGDDNKINGQRIYVKGNKNVIQGSQNFVLGSNGAKKVLKGDNIVRIADYDIDLDQIEKIKIWPEYAIVFNNV